MDQTRTACAGEQPTVASSGEVVPEKRVIGGDAAAAAAAGGGCFDCNICLECATEPVATLCGHLYCWPCIYEWLRPDNADAGAGAGSSDARRQCPVCKAAVSPDALVPLYGRGGSSSAKKPSRGPASIPRQSAQGQVGGDDNGVHRHHHHHRNVETNAPARAPLRHHHHADAAQLDALLPTPFVDRGMMHSTAGGVLGGMAVAVLPWVLRVRGQVQPPGMYYASPPYHLMNPRQRRRHVELERSLHQIWLFLFVFVLLCLLLF